MGGPKKLNTSLRLLMVLKSILADRKRLHCLIHGLSELSVDNKAVDVVAENPGVWNGVGVADAHDQVTRITVELGHRNNGHHHELLAPCFGVIVELMGLHYENCADVDVKCSVVAMQGGVEDVERYDEQCAAVI